MYNNDDIMIIMISVILIIAQVQVQARKISNVSQTDEWKS